MSEPRTEAGRRMLGRWWPEIPRQADRDMSRGRENATAAILAIEAEARLECEAELRLGLLNIIVDYGVGGPDPDTGRIELAGAVLARVRALADTLADREAARKLGEALG